MEEKITKKDWNINGSTIEKFLIFESITILTLRMLIVHSTECVRSGSLLINQSEHCTNTMTRTITVILRF